MKIATGGSVEIPPVLSILVDSMHWAAEGRRTGFETQTESRLNIIHATLIRLWLAPVIFWAAGSRRPQRLGELSD